MLVDIFYFQIRYFAYKFPNLGKKIPNQNVRFGIGYAYITSKNSSAWTLSTFGVNDTNSLIGRTLSPLYDSNSVTSWHILYNDQSPSGSENTKRGHTKGVVLGKKLLTTHYIYNFICNIPQ